jgi:hypothetical protein
MSWIRENKFLAGFIAVMALGAIGLGAALIILVGTYNGTHNTFTMRKGQLNALQNRQPYPNADNLKSYEQQQDQLATVINGLEQKLAAVQFPLDPTMTPAKFQARLQETVNEELAKAQASGVQLPDKFALGFDRYLGQPPNKEAAAPLDRELSALKFIFDELLDGKGVQSIGGGQAGSSVAREPLPEENGGKSPTDLVVKSPVQISFTADPLKFRKILNDLIETNKQFYIVRLLQVHNQGDKELPKADAIKNRMRDNKINLVLGSEKLDVTLWIEIVNFNPPDAAAAASATPKPK